MDQPFIVTKEHRRFTEFANAVRKEHTIGICHGDAGVGKTYSARRYANWDALEPYITEWRSRDAEEDAKHFSLANRSRAVFYTPEVLCRPRELMAEIHRSQVRIASCIDGHLHRNDTTTPRIMNGITKLVELLIIDEAERLTPTALELLRDNHDRTHLGIILIGMPGIDQRFRHYPQLYSRLGFSHRYRALGRDELLFVLDRHWKRLGRSLDPDDFTDAQAIAAIERITRGNFRLLERLFPQITRVLKINQLETITDDVIEATGLRRTWTKLGLIPKSPCLHAEADRGSVRGSPSGNDFGSDYWDQAVFPDPATNPKLTPGPPEGSRSFTS